MNIFGCCPKKPKKSLDYIIKWVEETDSILKEAIKWIDSIKKGDLKPIFDAYAASYPWDTLPIFDTKADKVENAVAGNFAALDSNGNLVDSRYQAGDFASADHYHNSLKFASEYKPSEYNIITIEETNSQGKIFIRLYDSEEDESIFSDYITAGQLNNAFFPVTSPMAGSQKLITSGGVYNALHDLDTEPTINSDKLITSGAVANLIRRIGNTSVEEMPIIKIGEGAVSEGCRTGAVKDYSHAEGLSTVAAGTASHAEGDGGYNDREAIDVTKFWVVRNPNIGGEIDYCKIIVDCAQNYTPDMFVSVGDVISYKDVSTFEDKYASVRGVSYLPGTVEFYLQLSSPIKINVTSTSLSKTLYKIPSGAFGRASHVEGLGTIAKADYQHVQGKYNVADTNNDYAFIIGNGTANDARSNAFAIKWDGTIASDKVKLEVNDGTNYKSAEINVNNIDNLKRALGDVVAYGKTFSNRNPSLVGIYLIKGTTLADYTIENINNEVIQSYITSIANVGEGMIDHLIIGLKDGGNTYELLSTVHIENPRNIILYIGDVVVSITKPHITTPVEQDTWELGDVIKISSLF